MKKIFALFTPLVLFLGVLAGCDGESAPLYKLDFIVDNNVYYTVNTTGNEVVNMPNNPTKEDYDFDGWYFDRGTWQNEFVYDTLVTSPISSDTSVYAKWLEIIKPLLTFEGFEKVDDTTYKYTVSSTTETLNLLPLVKAREDVNWYVGSDPAVTEEIGLKVVDLTVGNNTYYIKADSSEEVVFFTINIYRKDTYHVTFDSKGGTDVEECFVEEGSLIHAPTSTREGYTLVSWGYDFSNPVNEDLALEATWEANKYTITYNPNGGEVTPNTQQVTYDAVYDLVDPTREGYTFLGWYIGDDKVEPGVYQNAYDIELEAHWQAIDYTITYDLDGGSTSEPNRTSYNIETQTFSLHYPVRTGYTFIGWTGNGITTPVKNITITSGSTGDRTYTANWEIANYEISYNLNGGTVESNPTSYTYFTPTFTLNNPTREDYTFLGWSGTGIDGYSDHVVIPSGSIGDRNYTANWKYDGYYIHYSLNGGINASNNPTQFKETSATLFLESPSRVGYIFDGWYDNEAFVGDDIENIPTGTDHDVYLYAKWTPITYHVTFLPNGGEGEMLDMDFTYDEIQALSSNTFTKYGYDFLGWASTSNATQAQYEDEQEVKNLCSINDDTKTLYAIWKGKTFTIYFDNGDGSGASSATATYDSSLPSVNAPNAPYGYIFLGYFDADGNQYYDASMHSLKSWDKIQNVVLYAKYEAKKSTVIFNNGNGTGGTSSVEATYASSMPSVSTPTYYGYTFTGYYDADGNQYYDADMNSARVWDRTESITLYARYSPVKVFVSFNGVDGSGTITSYKATYGENLPEVSITVSRTGYIFLGYFDASGVKYYDENLQGVRVWDKAENTTLYAHWQAKQYTVYLDHNNGTGIKDTITVTYDQPMPSATAPNKADYIFTGYRTEDGIYYYRSDMSSGRNWNIDENTTLYASWEYNSYTLYFSMNGGSPSQESLNVVKGLELPTLEVIPTRRGYTFDGYYDSLGVKYYDSDLSKVKSVWDKTGDTTLYAYWNPLTFTVYLDNGEGEGGATSVTATYGEVLPYASKPTALTGYQFAGYYSESGDCYYSSSMYGVKTWTLLESITLYAHYEEAIYTVRIDNNGGTGSTTSFTVKYNGSLPTFTAPSRSGYTFKGYFDENDVQYYTASMSTLKSYDKTENSVLYAHWELATYTITFDFGSGTGSETSATVTYTQELPELTSIPTREYYTFIGYYDYDGNQYYDGDLNPLKTWDKPYNATLYAHYTGNPFTITFDKGDGEGGTTTVTAHYGEYLPEATAPSLIGYTFVGYYSFNEVEYYNGRMESTRRWDIGEDSVLYARYELTDYYVTLSLDGTSLPSHVILSFDLNGGEGSIPSQNITSTNGMVYPSSPTRSGYIFAGWYRDSECQEIFDFSAPISHNTTVYAKWIATPSGATVITYGNNTINIVGGVDNYFAFVPLKSGDVTLKVGKNAWIAITTSKSDSGTHSYDETTYRDIIAGNLYYVHLESYWNKTSSDYTGLTYLNFYGDITPAAGGVIGNDGSALIGIAHYQQPFEFEVPERTGYDFVGWFEGLEDDSIQYTNALGQGLFNYELLSDCVLYAHWTVHISTIVFDHGEGVSDVTSIELPYGSELPTLMAPTRDYYDFIGYFDADGNQYYDEEMNGLILFESDETVTLYAHYAPKSYLVTFDKGPGEGGSDSVNATYSLRMPDAEAPTYYGHDFIGYFDADGNQYYDEAMLGVVDFEKCEPITLYARYEASTYVVTLAETGSNERGVYTVTFDLMGGVGDIAPQVVDADHPLIYPTNPTKDGYVFAGWYLEDTYENKYRFSGAIGSDFTLYACYLEVPTYLNNWTKNGNNYQSNNHSDSSTGIFRITAPCTIYVSFSYSVSSESGYDYLRGYNGGTNLFSISGSQSSSTTRVTVYSGNTLEFKYSKDGSVSRGSDCGYVNNLVIISGEEYVSTAYVEDLYIPPVTVNVTYGEEFEIPTIVEKEGQTFIGWFDEGLTQYTDALGNGLRNWDKGENTTLYPQYSLNEYTITFESNGGNEIDSITQYYGTALVMPENPTLYNKSFDGWYLEDTFETAFTSITMPGEDITLYAKWVDYDILVDYEHLEEILIGDDLNADLFNFEAIDTDGRHLEVDIEIVEGELAVGEIVSIKFTVNGLYDHVWSETLTGVKVYGAPTITYDESVDYISYYGSFVPSLFNASAVDSFGNPLDVTMTTREDSYRAGDTITILLSATDSLGHTSVVEIPNVKVYGNPSITYDTYSTNIKVSDEITPELFNATATDTFGESLPVEATIHSGYQEAGNTLTVYLTTRGKGNEYTLSLYVKVYGTPTISDASFPNIGESDSVNSRKIGVSAYDSFGNSLDLTMEKVDGVQEAGNTLTYKFTAADTLGNTATKLIEVRVYGAPTITYDTSVDKINYTSGTMIPSLEALNATCLDSFGEECEVYIEVYDGNYAGGKTVKYRLYGYDIIGNYGSITTDNIKIYSAEDIKIVFDENVTAIKVNSHGEEFNASADNSFGDICDIDIEIESGYRIAGTTVDLYITATDCFNNVKRSSLIRGVKLYGTPSFTYLKGDNYIQESDDPNTLFMVYDSFSNPLDFDVEISGGSFSNPIITYHITAEDVFGNELSAYYTLYVLNNDESVIELFVEDDVVQTIRVNKGEDYHLYLDYVDNNTWYYNGTAYTDSNGDSLSVWDKDSGVYRFILEDYMLEFSITYVLNGGVDNGGNLSSYNSLDSFTFNSLSANEERHFVGWYSDPSFIHRVYGINPGDSGNLVLYAKWENHTLDENCVCTGCGNSYHHYVDGVCEHCGKSSIDIWDGTTATDFAGGSGTETDPFLISTGSQLALLASRINNSGYSYSGSYFKLTNSIDLNNFEWTPIGKYASSGTVYYFGGILDGDGYTIKNLYINTASKDSIGLFSYVNGGGIKNLRLSDVTITAYYYDRQIFYVAGFVGYANQSTFSNLVIDGSIASTQYNSTTVTIAGSIVGHFANNSTMEKCVSSCDINVRALNSGYNCYVGGLIGRANSGVINDCYYHGTIYCTSNSNQGYGAGIIGIVNTANTVTLRRCASVLNVQVDSDGYYSGIYIPWDGYAVTTYDCYYNISATSGTHKPYCTSALASNLQNEDWLTTTFGWDFNTTWKMENDYPTLRIFD